MGICLTEQLLWGVWVPQAAQGQPAQMLGAFHYWCPFSNVGAHSVLRHCSESALYTNLFVSAACESSGWSRRCLEKPSHSLRCRCHQISSMWGSYGCCTTSPSSCQRKEDRETLVHRESQHTKINTICIPIKFYCLWQRAPHASMAFIQESIGTPCFVCE